MMMSISSGNCVNVSALIWVLTPTSSPAARTLAIAASAISNDPGTPRSRSCVGADAIDRDPDGVEPGIGSGPDAVGGQVAAAGLQVAFHAGSADGGDDLQPVLAQIGLAADQADAARAQFGDLADEIDRFRARQFVASPSPGARAAMLAGQIAGEGDFPDDTHRHPPENVVETGIADRQRLHDVDVRALDDQLDPAGRRHLAAALRLADFGGLDQAIEILVFGLELLGADNQGFEFGDVATFKNIEDDGAVIDAARIEQLVKSLQRQCLHLDL